MYIGRKIRPRYEYVKTFIYEYKTENTRNWFRYETFYYLFEFKFFRHEERETQFLQQTHGTFRGPQIDYLPLDSDLNTLFQIPKSSASRFRAWRHSRPRSYFLYRVFMVTSLIIISALREYLHSMCAPN